MADRIRVSRMALAWMVRHIASDLPASTQELLEAPLLASLPDDPTVNVMRSALTMLLALDDNSGSRSPDHYMARRALDAAILDAAGGATAERARVIAILRAEIHVWGGGGSATALLNQMIEEIEATEQAPIPKFDECGNYPEVGPCRLPKGHDGCCGSGGPFNSADWPERKA
jgi:hypothetical protein